MLHFSTLGDVHRLGFSESCSEKKNPPQVSAIQPGNKSPAACSRNKQCLSVCVNELIIGWLGWALQQQRRVLPDRLLPPGHPASPGQEAAGQRGEVVARVQHVGAAPLALLLPHEVGAGREEWPRALAVQLQDDAAHAQRHPHGEHGEVWRRRRRRREGAENTRLALADQGRRIRVGR